MLPSKLGASGGPFSAFQSQARPILAYAPCWPAAASPKAPVARRELGPVQRRSGLAPRHVRCRLGNVGSSEERGCLVSCLRPLAKRKYVPGLPGSQAVYRLLVDISSGKCNFFSTDVHVFPYVLRQWQAPEARYHSADSVAPLKAWCTTLQDGTRSLSAATPGSDAPRGVLSWRPTFWDSC